MKKKWIPKQINKNGDFEIIDISRSNLEFKIADIAVPLIAPDKSRDRIRKDAHLIAAAPDLLRACWLVLAINDTPVLQSHPIKLDPQAEKQIRAAIAKALRGEAISR